MTYCEKTGKRCMTYGRAQEVIRNAKQHIGCWGRKRKKYGGKQIPQRSYLCQFCGQWHVTHLRKERRVRKMTKSAIDGL